MRTNKYQKSKLKRLGHHNTKMHDAMMRIKGDIYMPSTKKSQLYCYVRNCHNIDY